MKKLLCLLISIAMMASMLTACGGSEQPETTSPITVPTMVPTSVSTEPPTTPPELKTYPLNSDSTYTALAQEVPYLIYSTTGAENGLEGTIYRFTGETVDFFTNGENPYIFENIVVDTGSGKVMITNFYTAIYNATLLEFGADLTKAYYPHDVNDFIFPDVGETANFIAVYSGYSLKYEMPMFYLGANSSLFKMLEMDDPTIAPTQPEAENPVNTADFFGDPERQAKYQEYFQSYQLGELLEYVNAYIDENGPQKSDSAYKILDILGDEIVNICEKCTISYDSFEETYTAYYSGVEEISTSVCIVPRTSGSDYRVFAGFQKDDWLFFDRISIKLSESDDTLRQSFDSWDVETDVINGGIEEYALLDIGEDDAELFGTSQDVIIRFENSETDETFDHELSESERMAVYGLYEIRDAYVDLSNLLYRWNNGGGISTTAQSGGNDSTSGSKFDVTYVLDLDRKVFHYIHCRILDELERESQETYVGQRQDLIEDGYSACDKCRS